MVLAFEFLGIDCSVAGLALDRFGAPVIVPTTRAAALALGNVAGGGPNRASMAALLSGRMADAVRYGLQARVRIDSAAPSTWSGGVRGSMLPGGDFIDFATPIALTGSTLLLNEEAVTLPYLALEHLVGQAGVKIDLYLTLSDKERG